MLFSFLNNYYRKTAYKLAVDIVFMVFPVVFLGSTLSSQNQNPIISLERIEKPWEETIINGGKSNGGEKNDNSNP